MHKTDNIEYFISWKIKISSGYFYPEPENAKATQL